MTESSHHPAEQELLQQVRWIQGVAFAILRDYELAQDVSQEVLLKALSGERRKGRVLRAWLAAVTRNASISLLRERNRRESREFRAAQPEELAAIRNPLEILEAHESLTKAIHALPADAREIILLRFFENLDFPAIAQRVGIREDAARVRLHRALGLLRSALGRKESGWQSWCALALPAGTSHLLPPSSRIAELLLMKAAKPVAFVLAAGLLLLALIFGPDWRETREPHLDPAELAAAGLPAPGAAGAETAAAEPVLARSEAVTASAMGSWILRGRVEIPGGGDAGGHRVRAFLYDGYDLECPILEETVLTSSADGTLSWPRDPPTGAVYVALQPEAKGVGYGDGRLVLKGTEPPQDLEVVIFRWTTAISGVVRNEAGAPLAGALVRGGFEPAIADGEGRYQLMGRAGSGEAYLYAEADGYAQEKATVRVAGDVPTEMDITLRREFIIRGQVLDEQGAPIAGAVVDTFGPFRNSVLTDVNGRYELRHLQIRQSSHHLYVRLKGYVESAIEVKVENRTSAVQDLVLKRGTRVEGRVVGPDGAPLEGASLYIGFSPSAYNRIDAVSHDNGVFSFSNVAAGNQTLITQFPGLAADRRVLKIPADASTLSGLDIALTAGQVAAGQVLDQTGSPLSEVWISVTQGREYIDFDFRVQTDAEGRFRIPGLPSEDISLEFHKAGLIRTTVPLLQSDQEDLRVTMSTAGALRGRVVNGVTGLPVEAFRIRLFHPFNVPSGEKSVSTYSWDESALIQDKDGAWATEASLEVGRFIGVEATAPGYSPLRMDNVRIPAPSDASVLEFRLMPGAQLRGRVLPSSGGSPVQNATLSILREDQLRPGGTPETVSARISIANEQGEFVFLDLPAGRIYLHVSHVDWLTTVVGPIDLIPGAENPEQSIYLEVGATLRGRVLNPDGTPMVGMTINAYGYQITNLPYYKASGQTDSSGRFSIPHLYYGQYRISVSSGVVPNRTAIFTMARTLREGDDQEVILQAAGSCSIHGLVTCEKPLPENLQVQIDPYPYSGSSTSPLPSGLLSIHAPVVQGSYEFPALEPGKYVIKIDSFSAGGKTQYSTWQLIELQDGVRMEINLNPVAKKQ